jgi:hypothetical protein
MHLTACVLGQIVVSFFKLLLIAPGDQDAHAFFQKLPRGLESDAAAAAGYDRTAAFDSQIHLTLPLTLLAAT